jgi:hypothetical protein
MDRRRHASTHRVSHSFDRPRVPTKAPAILTSAVTGPDPRRWTYLQADYGWWHALRMTRVADVTPIANW